MSKHPATADGDGPPAALEPAERTSIERLERLDREDDRLRRRLGHAASRRPPGPRLAAFLASVLDGRRAGDEAIDELARRAQDDPAAREALVEALLPRIVAAARRHAGPSAEFADLVQEGVVGVLEALVRFDPERGPFAGYASSWIRGNMIRLVQDQRRAMRLPPQALRELAALKEAGAELGSSASLAAAAERAGLRVERAEELLRADAPTRSLEEADETGEDEWVPLRDMVPDPRASAAYDEIIERAGQPELSALLGALTDRERHVVERRFGLDDRPEETLAQVGERLGVTRERVRQIEARALRKLAQAGAAPAA